MTDEFKDNNRQEWALQHGEVAREYQLIRRIGQGATSTAYLAKDADGKEVRLTFIEHDKLFERLRFKAHCEGKTLDEATQEARAQCDAELAKQRERIERVKGLGDEHVCRLFGTALDQGKNQLVVVSEYLPGVDLNYAARMMSRPQLISLAAQSLRGLAYIHQSGFWHFNVKPSRIVVNVEHTPFQAKLVDFGYALPKGDYHGELMGTALYVAPEIAFGDVAEVGDQADLYSWALMFYTFLVGYHPFEERREAERDRRKLQSIVKREMILTPPSHCDRTIPKDLDWLLLDLLNPDVSKRTFKSAYEVLQYLQEKWPKECTAVPYESSTLVTEGEGW